MIDIKVMCASVLKHSLVHLGVWRPVLWDRSWCCLTGALTLVFPLITHSMGVKKSLVRSSKTCVSMHTILFYYFSDCFGVCSMTQLLHQLNSSHSCCLWLAQLTIQSTLTSFFLVNTFEKKSVGAFQAWELDDFCTFLTRQMIANNPIPQLFPLCPSTGCCSHLQLFLFSKSFVSSTSTDMRCKLISIMHLQ